MAGMTELPFYINPKDGFAIADGNKTRGVKPSIVGMACPFFGASAPESISDSVISSIMTKVRGARGILYKRSCKYSSQSFLDPINIELWLVLAWVLGGHRLAALQSFLYMTSLSIQIILRSAKL